MNVRAELEKAVGVAENIQLNDIELDPLKIKTIMINEVVPADPTQDFYGQRDADYLTTTIPLFQKSGLPVKDIQDILHMGVYITNAVKTPKSDYTIEKTVLKIAYPT